MSESNTKSSGISFAGLLFIVFLVLKLTGVITWSWWWVTAPLWGGFAIFFAILALVGLIALIANR
jgi:hypothetical protein